MLSSGQKSIPKPFLALLLELYATSGLKVSRSPLPRRTYRSKTSTETTTRCFVEKFPIFYEESKKTDSPIVSFCYIDYGARTTAGFDSFLRSYTSLFNRLGSVRVVYVADNERHVESIGRKIKALSSLMHSCADASPSFVRSLLDYFQLEHLYQTHQLRRLGQQGLIELREARRRFHREEIEPLFRLWKSRGEKALIDQLSRPETVSHTTGINLFVYQVKHDYSYLGAYDSD